MSSFTVLVVEDNPSLADLFRAWLERTYRVEVAADGGSALDAVDARGDDIDVVLLDRRLPDVSGDDVLAILRERGRSYYVVVVSAIDPDATMFDLEFDDYLVKPTTYDDIHRAVERGVEVRGRSDDVRTLHRLLVKERLIRTCAIDAGLRGSDRYAALTRRIERLAARVEEPIPGFEGG